MKELWLAMNPRMQIKPVQERWLDVVKRLGSYREQVALLCDEYPKSRELVESNPALALCIARAQCWDVLRDKSPCVIQTLLDVKRRHVCGLLGFPETETTVRILAKIIPEACSIPLLMRLRRNFSNDALVKTLRHLTTIDEGGLFLAAYWSWGEFLTHSLFKEMAAMCALREFSEISRLMRDTMQMDNQVQLVKRPPRSVAELHHIHDRLVQAINAEPEDDYQWIQSLQFPPAPLPGNDKIVPIETPAMLIEEGKTQHHCVAVMGYSIKEGDTYIYRILEPERATLAIDYILGGWCIGELRATCNRRVKGETLRMVQDWMDRELQGFRVPARVEAP